MEHYRKGDSLEPIEPLVLQFPSGKEIQVDALGYALVKPCIAITQTSQVGISLRTKTESIAFTMEHFDLLYNFLTKAKRHWES